MNEETTSELREHELKRMTTQYYCGRREVLHFSLGDAELFGDIREFDALPGGKEDRLDNVDQIFHVETPLFVFVDFFADPDVARLRVETDIDLPEGFGLADAQVLVLQKLQERLKGRDDLRTRTIPREELLEADLLLLFKDGQDELDLLGDGVFVLRDLADLVLLVDLFPAL